MGANIAGIYGAQIFRSEDSPRYRRGFSIGIGVLSLAVTLATARWIDDVWFGGRKSLEIDDADERVSEDGDSDDHNKTDKLPSLNLDKQPQSPLGIGNEKTA